jgi:cytochrome b pre-mRNA-processing protein 3
MSGGKNMFERLLGSKDPLAEIRLLYGAVVAQARSPRFYIDFAIPDTIEGRFDMVLLHVYLVWRRLSKAGAAERAAAQQVFDLFFEDMDESMRELGVGDLSVPRKVRAMGEAFYGRAGVYDAALARADDTELVAALQRNIFTGEADRHTQAAHLAAYVRATDHMLAKQSAGVIAGGKVAFPEPEDVLPLGMSCHEES